MFRVLVLLFFPASISPLLVLPALSFFRQQRVALGERQRSVGLTLFLKAERCGW